MTEMIEPMIGWSEIHPTQLGGTYLCGCVCVLSVVGVIGECEWDELSQVNLRFDNETKYSQ